MIHKNKCMITWENPSPRHENIHLILGKALIIHILNHPIINKQNKIMIILHIIGRKLRLEALGGLKNILIVIMTRETKILDNGRRNLWAKHCSICSNSQWIDLEWDKKWELSNNRQAEIVLLNLIHILKDKIMIIIDSIQIIMILDG